MGGFDADCDWFALMPTTPLFSLCHATARLPFGWTAAYETWTRRAARPEQIEYVLAVDRADFQSGLADYVPHAKHPVIFTPRLRLVVNEGRRCAVDGWNAAAAASTGRFLISVADDLFPPWDWDAAISDLIPDFDGEYVLDVDYGEKAQRHFLYHSFLTRAYYERIGSRFFWPEYDGMRADDEFTAIAFRDGVVINATRLVFPHLHPSYALRPDDALDHRHQRPEAFELGDKIFARRKAEGFPL